MCKKYYEQKLYKNKKILNNCIICKKEFVHWCKKKTCSKECYKKLLSIITSKNENCGGETHFKRFKYNEISMDSSWEVDLAKWLDLKNIKWIRSKKLVFIWIDSGKKRRYHPDFYLPDFNVYLDPKNGYKVECDKKKLDYVMNNYDIKLFYGELDYIKNKIEEIMGV